MEWIFTVMCFTILGPAIAFVIMKYGAYGWFKGKRLAERQFKKE